MTQRNRGDGFLGFKDSNIPVVKSINKDIIINKKTAGISSLKYFDNYKTHITPDYQRYYKYGDLTTKASHS